MSYQLPPPLPEAATLLNPEAVRSSMTRSRGRRSPWKLLRTWSARVWQFSVGMVLVQSVFGALLVAGWTSRWMRRAGLLIWLNASGLSWKEAVSRLPELREAEEPPRWLLSQSFAEEWNGWGESRGGGRIRLVLRAMFSSLRWNFWRGLQWMGNTALLTLPGTLLMLFSWYDGWNNSFNKGYEQALVGPLMGWLGILLLVAAMFYLPFAQARQAMTGDWRSFYDFGLVWKLVRRAWLGSALLALGYAMLSVPVTILKTAPGFFPQMSPRLAQMTPDEARHFLDLYFLAAAAVVLPCYWFLHVTAVRLYARQLLRSIQSGGVAEADLDEAEWRCLHSLGLLRPVATPEAPRWRRVAAWVATRTGQAVAAAVMGLAWFVCIGQIYLGEFLIYHPITGFLNHPLIQLPWFHYVP